MDGARLARSAALLAAGGVATAVVADQAIAAVRRSPVRPIHVGVQIAAPLEAVWAVVSDIPRQPEWMREMKSVRILSDGPVARGTMAEATVRIFGIAVTDPVEITEWHPPSRFAIRHQGLFRGSGRLTLREGVPAAEGIPPTTIVAWREILVPPALAHLGSLLGWPILRWIFQDDLYRLRDLIEDGPEAGGAVVAGAAG